MSTASARDGFVSGAGSISPGRSLRGSSSSSCGVYPLTTLHSPGLFPAPGPAAARSAPGTGAPCALSWALSSSIALGTASPGAAASPPPLATTPSSSRTGSATRTCHQYNLRRSPTHHLALHCFADFLTSSEETLDQLLRPYFMTAALRTSSSLFFHTPPFSWILIMPVYFRLQNSAWILDTAAGGAAGGPHPGVACRAPCCPDTSTHYTMLLRKCFKAPLSASILSASRQLSPVCRPGHRCLSGASSPGLDSTDNHLKPRSKTALLGVSATAATVVAGYLLYDAFHVPASVRTALTQIRTNKAVSDLLGDDVTIRSDWTVEQHGDEAFVRVNASGSKTGGMFTCALTQKGGEWKVTALDVIYHER
ncbi:DNA-cytosine methyltransferase, putative [Babesia caballi]|uniref:DNA-cytosine methyltransferase, putative n=1 Tax=Babesia caballi TaxID=5871 RepID=A0AAV4LYT0_BABCB|nr:DNA-cytosine methyltransferase, putative [Babesia caballi]